MDSCILLGKILQRLSDQGFCQVKEYKKFIYVRETDSSVHVLRENEREAIIPFNKLQVAIKAYQHNNLLYDEGPNALRNYGLTHITSPIFFSPSSTPQGQLLIRRHIALTLSANTLY